MSSLPSKLFFRIGEVAGLVGVEPHVLRYWEREFRSIRPTKSAKGQRVYSRRDVENLLRVRDLLYRDGFTIAGAKKRLQTGSSAEPRDAEETAHEPDSSDPSQTEIVIAAAQVDVDADVAAPASSSSAAVDSRGKLAALRAEVESFLEELEDRSEQGEP
ncbi:MAG TPA: MerR family transcriptional regulator, partial [Labilithrix sp.]|nr:MerR family transcriptional regulator [Labilithrix sp.]